MSLESAIADLVSASSALTQAVNVTRASVEEKVSNVKSATTEAGTAEAAIAATKTSLDSHAATISSKKATVVSDYAAQQVAKGLPAVVTAADTALMDELHRRDPARYPFRGARPSLVMDFVRRECHRNNAAGNLEPVDLSTFMTFTRGSTATYVGPDGLIKTAGVNEARYGYDPVTGEALGLLVEEQRTNLIPGDRINTWSAYGTFTRSSTLITPAGDLSAYKLCKTSGTFTEFHIRKNTGVQAAGSYCLSICVHETSDSVITLRPVHISCATPTSQVNFNPVSKTFSSQGGYADITKCGYTVLSGGWVRAWLVFTTPSSSSVDAGINLYTADGVGDGVSGAFLWGAQLEAGSFPTSYIPTPATFTGRASTKTYFDSNGVMQTAASGVAVTDYGYVDGRWVSKGLSLEGQATNLLTKSAQVLWTNGQTGNTVGLSLVTNTDPCTNAAIPQMVNALVTGAPYHPYISSWGAVVTAGGVYTLTMRLRLTTGESDLTSISMYNGTSISSTGFPVKAADGFKTVTLTFSGVATGPTYPMVSCSKYDLVYMQLETGPVATSYIPTTTAQVTRAADTSTSAQVTRASESAVSTQAAALYNLDAGTTCVEAKYSIRGVYPGLYSWNNDYFIFTATALNQLVLNGRGSNGTMFLTPPAGDTTLRHAVRRNRLNLKSAVNNSALTGASLSLSPTTTVTTLYIGRAYSYWNGYIRQLTYFPRQLSDADLQALTILED